MAAKSNPPNNHEAPFGHSIFFQLTDTSDQAIDLFVAACSKYLSGHQDQLQFSVGTRALQVRRPVSALDFVVSVHSVFANFSAYQRYSADPRHEAFITETAGMSPSRIVYDSFLRSPLQPAAKSSEGQNGH